VPTRQSRLVQLPKGKAMSTKVLYHTFGIRGVHDEKAVLWAA